MQARTLLSPHPALQACFLPGLVALGHLHNISTVVTDLPSGASYRQKVFARASDLELAKEMGRTCYEMYRGTASVGAAAAVTRWIISGPPLARDAGSN